MLYGFAASPTYTHMRADCVWPGLNIGWTVSSVATTCDFLTRSAMRWYNGSTTSATSPHHTDCVARENSNPFPSKKSSQRYRGGEIANFLVTIKTRKPG